MKDCGWKRAREVPDKIRKNLGDPPSLAMAKSSSDIIKHEKSLKAVI